MTKPNALLTIVVLSLSLSIISWPATLFAQRSNASEQRGLSDEEIKRIIEQGDERARREQEKAINDDIDRMRELGEAAKNGNIDAQNMMSDGSKGIEYQLTDVFNTRWEGNDVELRQKVRNQAENGNLVV